MQFRSKLNSNWSILKMINAKTEAQLFSSPAVLVLFSVRLTYPILRGRGGTLIFSYIRRLWSFLGVKNFEFQNFLGFSENCIFFEV